MRHPEPLSVPHAIESRRSIRRYTDDPMPDEDLNELLRLAGLAPSPDNLQPWRVIAVRDHEMKQKLMAAAFNQKQVGASAVTLVLYSDMADVLSDIETTVHPGMADRRAEVVARLKKTHGEKSEEDREEWGNAISYIFLGFLLLAAQSMGYATSPMLGFDPEQVKSLFGLPAHVRIPALIAIGVAAEDGFPHHRHPLERFVKVIG